MRRLILDILVVHMMLGVAALALASPSNAQYVITEIIDATGDGGENTLGYTQDVAVDFSGNVYVTGAGSDNAFKIAPGGTITEIIDATGDGGGNTLELPEGIAVDSNGNAYVIGYLSNNAFKITSGGTVTEIIDATGDGAGNTLERPRRIAVDPIGNVYVTGANSDNAFKIATPGTCSTSGDPCAITEIIDAAGDRGGNTLDNPTRVAADSSGNIYVTGFTSSNAFKIVSPGTCSTGDTPCTITEIIDWTGDGGGNELWGTVGVAVGSDGNVYVTGNSSVNAFKITPGGAITEIIDWTGDGNGNILDLPWGVGVDSYGNVYVAGMDTHNAFKITPGGTITEIIDETGDGGGNELWGTDGVAVDCSDNVYVVGFGTHNAFKIRPGLRVPVLSNRGLAVLGVSLAGAALWLARRQRLAKA